MPNDPRLALARDAITAAITAEERRLAGLQAGAPTQLERPPQTIASASQGIDLDQPAQTIFTLDRRELDQLVRVIERELDVSYIDAVTRLDEAYTEASRLLRSKPLTVGDLLRGAGVKNLDAANQTVSLTQQRDEAVQRQLNAELASVSAQKVDAQGRVELDSSIDVPSLLRDDEARERRWRAARAVSPLYAERARFDEDDSMLLEAGFDLVAALERPAVVARAQQHAGELTYELDQVIESERSESARRRELDGTIAALEARRDGPAPAVVKTLDAPDKVPTFIELNASQMDMALREWDLRGHDAISLDDAAAIVTGHAPAPTARPKVPRGRAGDRVELASEVTARQREGASFADAFEQATGVALDG
jgi:hypothetical protein